MLSIVIPTYKQPQNIPLTCEMIHQFFNSLCSKETLVYEIIFVDDGSCDETKELLKKITCQDPLVKGIILKENVGQQMATLIGLAYATKEYIITMDDDLSYHPRSIIALLKEIRKGYDVVYGVLERPHEKYYRRLGTQIKEMLFSLVLRKPWSLRLSSFRIMNQNVRDFVIADLHKKIYISGRTLQYTKRVKHIIVPNNKRARSSRYTMKRLISLLYVALGYVDFFSKSKRRWFEQICTCDAERTSTITARSDYIKTRFDPYIEEKFL